MFGIGKPSCEASDQTRQLLDHALVGTGVGLNTHTPVYAYCTYKGLFAKKVRHYALGIARDLSEMVVVQLNMDGLPVDTITFHFDDIASARKSVHGETILKSTNGETLTLVIPPFVGTDASTAHLLPINQEDTYACFEQFLQQ